MTENKTVLSWLDEMVAMCQPEKVVWIDGSEEQLEALRAEAVSTGEMIKLNEEKLPGCYYHRTAENDVARVEDRTFICTPVSYTHLDVYKRQPLVIPISMILRFTAPSP